MIFKFCILQCDIVIAIKEAIIFSRRGFKNTKLSSSSTWNTRPLPPKTWHPKIEWVYSPHPLMKISSTPNIIIPHPYQEIEDVLLFPHPPSRRRTPKACTYNKQHEYSIHIPSWKYASTPDTIFTHQKIEKLLLFPTSTLSLINNEGLHLQKTKMSILSSSPS